MENNNFRMHHLGVKTDDLGWGVRSDPPRAECVGRSKMGGLGGGPRGVPPKTKSVQKNYLGIVAKIQNNRLSHFLMVEVQKFRGQI